MAPSFRIFRVTGSIRENEALHIASARKAIEHARQVLANCPRPSSFAGHATHAPFPSAADPERHHWHDAFKK
jgi:hypothetical protein